MATSRKNNDRVVLHKGLLSGVIGAFCFGLGFGSYLTNKMSSLSNNKTMQILNDFLYNINEINSIQVFFRAFTSQFVYLFLIWMLGLTIIGIIGVFCIDFFIGFIYGYVITFFLKELGTKGIIFAFLYTFPQNIVIIPLTLFLSYFSVFFALSIYRSIYVSYNKRDIIFYINNYFKIMMITIVVLIVYSLLIVFVNPTLLKYIINIS